MAFTLTDVLDGARSSRKHFLKHLRGVTPQQWDWKPYSECKSIHETVTHLVGDDRAALQSFRSGGEPDYEGIMAAVESEAPSDQGELLAMLDRSHSDVCSFIETEYADAPLDRELNYCGSRMKLGSAVAYLSSEDFYHAGQIAFVRMASDPSWDYYGSIYGGD